MQKKSLYSFLALVFTIFLSACTPKSNPSIYQTETTEINDSYPEDEAVLDVIDDYKDQLDAQMDRVIGYFAHEMHKKLPESELGNFMCDAPMAYISKNMPDTRKIDFCLMNYGGIRINHLPEGEVTVEDMFEIMPFENELVIVNLSGDKLKAVMDRVAKKGGWPISKEVNVVIENEEIRDFLIHGEPVDWNKTYRVLLSDYIANGGDGMEMLEDLPKEVLNIKLRDAMIGYCEMMTTKREPITARINGRIIVID